MCISMEFEEVHDNLRAIRLLYRLLEDNSLALQHENSDDLVERARDLLKSLLDVAVESVFETHLKIIAKQSGISRTPSEQEKHVEVVESKSPVAANTSQSSVKYPTCSKMTSQKDEQPQLKLLSKKELLELSKYSTSDDGGTKSKTLRSIGEENSMVQQNSVNVTNLCNEDGILPNTEVSYLEQHNNVSALYGDGEQAKESLKTFDAKTGEKNEENNLPLLNGIHEAQCNSNAARQVEFPDPKGDFSDDLFNSIRRIESRILAFQLCSNLVDTTKNSAGHCTVHKAANSDTPIIQRNDEASGSQLSCGKPVLEGHKLMNQKTHKPSGKGENSISENTFVGPFFTGNESLSQSQMANKSQSQMANKSQSQMANKSQSQKANQSQSQVANQSQNRIQISAQNIAKIDRIKSLNRLVSVDAYLGSQPSECIQGLRVPLNQDGHTKKHSMLASQTNRESLVRKNPVAWSMTDQNQKERSSESSYAQKLAGPKSVIARREKPPLPHMIIRPNLLDQRSSDIKVNSHQHRDSSVLDSRRIHKTGHLEPWKTRVQPQHRELEVSSSKSDSSHWTSQQGSVNSSSDSEGYSLPDGAQGPSSGRMVDAAYEGSSEESSNSYLDKDDGPYHKFGSIKSCRHRHERNPRKTSGGLRRLKNKLGLIFHHHHHHHHHHDDDDHGNAYSKAGHKHSMWNHLQNVFQHKNKHGVLTKPKDEKTKRGAVVRVLPQRNQVGQFHGLVKGILKHIRHSKKPNPSKLDGMKRSRNTRHGHSQKKLHWWQILRRHRRVKLRNKGRVKMTFMSQKSLKN